MNSKLEQIKKNIEKAYETKDAIDINNDIEEGKRIIKDTSESNKQIYIDKIYKKYFIFIDAVNVGMNLRKMNLGSGSTRNLYNRNETITQYIRILQLVLEGKLLDEIQKVIKNEKNVFCGGVINE